MNPLLKILYRIILFIYILSWILPIQSMGSGKTDPGFLGAIVSFSSLVAGLGFFVGAGHRGDNVISALLYIYAGLPNILFVICYVLLSFESRWSFFLSPLMLLTMLMWLKPGNLIGYYVWLLSGFSVFILSVINLKMNDDLKSANVILGKRSLIIYQPLALYLVLKLLSGPNSMF